MLYANNPEIDFTRLAEKVALELQKARPRPPYLNDYSGLSIKSVNDAILQSLDYADSLAAPRTTRPARFRRFPFRWIPFLGRLVVMLDNVLFFKERLALRQVTAALRQQVMVNRQLLDQITAIVSHLKDGD